MDYLVLAQIDILTALHKQNVEEHRNSFAQLCDKRACLDQNQALRKK